MMFSRRDVLRYSAMLAFSTMAAASVSGCAPGRSTPPQPPAAADFDRMVAAYRALQIGSGHASPARDQALRALDEVARGYDTAMRLTTDGPLWPDLPFGPGSTYFPMMYYRLRTIAVSWATAGSELSRRPELPDRIRAALDTLYLNQYNERTPQLGNWYVYEIGVPYWLLQTIVAMGDQLPPADRERLLRPVLRFVADPNLRTASKGLVETGANRADKALITVVSGALAGDAARVAAGVAAVTDAAGNGAASLVKRVTEGDGFRTDGSFIQHDVVPYPGHYGLVLLSAVAGLLHVTDGTSTQLAADVRQQLYDTVTDVFAPFLFAGAMMEPVRGRMLSRQGETGHDVGDQFIAAVVLLARTAPEPTRSEFAGLAAQWIADGTWAPYLEVSDLARFAGGLQPVGVPEIEFAEQLLASAPRRSGVTPLHRSFPQMDRMVHTTARWSASLGLSSTRTCRYEAINGQNQNGWYVGDGVLYLFLPEQQGHYSDAYWPTVDATLLPGTTQKGGPPPELVGNPPPPTPKAFAGGVRLDDGHGAYGLDFVSQDGTLTAKKSWFFTPNAVLCLGAGITDASGAPVRTTIENRGMGEKGAPALLVDGRPAPTALGRSTTLPGARWLHLAGVAGYVLLDEPATTPVTVLREARTGAWLDIDTGANTHGTPTRYTRRYQQIRLDHGTRPSGASYAYAVLPGASVAQTSGARQQWRVLRNSAESQAVQLDLGTFASIFHAAGTVDQVSVSGPAAVMWGPSGEGWTLALADPTQTQDVIRLTLERAGSRVVRTDPTVTVVGTDPALVLDVKVGGSLGATHSVTLS